MLESWEVDLNRHLSAIDRADAFDAAVEKRAAELMQPGRPFCPTDPYNRDEAISELPVDPAVLTDAELDRMVHDHWATAARNQAEYDLENECQRCFGRGCRKCDPPEPDYDD